MKKLFLVAFIFFITSTVYGAEEVCPIAKGIKSLETFKRIPILEAGRVKPLDTYARNVLLRFSGKQTFNKKPAIYWLARVIFDPNRTREDQVFLINHPAILQATGIEVEKHRRYSFAQLEEKISVLNDLAQKAKKIDSKERDIVESEIIRLYDNLELYSALTLTYSFALPHPDFTITDLKLKKDLSLREDYQIFSFIDLALKANELRQLSQPLEKIEESKWTSSDKELLQTISGLYYWSMFYNDLPFKIMPSYNREEETWLSPWDTVKDALQVQEARDELVMLRNILGNYWDGQQIKFDMEIKGYLDSIKKRNPALVKTIHNQNSLELFYNKLQLFYWVKISYLLIFFVFLNSLVSKNKSLKSFAFTALIVSVMGHALAILMRIMILHRPPVSNLYETFLFVGLISAIAGLFIELRVKNWLGIVVSSICGFIFLSIASKFSMEGDTLQMLVAVLNSNFWLSTHVTSITIGYSGVCVAGIVGHIYLIQTILKSKDADSTYRVLIGTLGFGLTMTFLGTNLGGIWADQSWGRFWGWDPKENGALMIILWTALLFHARMGKIIGPIGMAYGAVMGIMVVMWAWFGVNLLSIGLHSYGFTSGLARNLIIYFICEIVFLLVCNFKLMLKLEPKELDL